MCPQKYVSFPRAIPILIRSKLEAIFIWSWCTAISCLIVGKGFPPIKPAILSVLAMILISMSVYFYNDIIDKDMDALNPFKKNKPIASNIVREEDAIKITYLSGLIGLLITIFINIYSFIFAALYLILFFIYSYPKIRLKKMLLVNELTIFFGFPLTSLVASYAIINSLSIRALFSAILFGLFTFSVKPVVTDTLDMNEDKLYGHKTLGIILSWKRKIQLIIFVVLFIMTITPLTYVNLGYNIIVPIFVVAFSLILLGTIFPLMKEYNRIQVLKWKKIGHIYLILLQIIMVLGSLNLNLFI